MVVNSRKPEAAPRLDLPYLGLFLGMRVNQLVAEEMRATGFPNVRESHGYVIQHLIEQERSITELAKRMEVTQQAASKAVAEMAGLGLLEVVSGDDRRAKTVRLTAVAWDSIRLARRIRRRIQKRLIRVAGAERYKAASSVLTACLEALGGMERIRTRRVLPPQ